MCFFKKKKNDVAANQADSDLRNQIHVGLKSVVARASTDEVKDAANKLYRQVEYAPFSPKQSVQKIDQKIINQLSEAQVVLNKDPNATEKALAILKEIELLLIQREGAYKSSSN